jgi:tetratricopeptide (TPR) repeat protein
MKKMTALWTLALLVSATSGALATEHAIRSRLTGGLIPGSRMEAPPQAAAPQWKSRDEYDAFNAMAQEKDPNKKIQLAEAFIQKYPTSDFKAQALDAEMGVYYGMGKTDQAGDTARKILTIDPDNLDALSLLSYMFPFTFKLTDADATAKFARADGDAHHGLDVLQKFQKPAGVTDEQFKQYVSPKRAIFNGAIGFVALQRKDYPAAIAALKAAIVDNPSDIYTFYRLGVAYISSQPPDTDHAIWYLARAVSLGQAGSNNSATEISDYLKKVYVDYHGNEDGLADIIKQTASSPNPPDGFKVAQIQAPAKTGDANVDAYNELTFPLKLGGPKAQEAWDAIKGKPLGLAGFVDSIEKSPDAPDTYLIRIDILDTAKATPGTWDVEVKDNTAGNPAQAKVTNLSPGDPVRFNGTISSYVATPSLVLSVDGTIDPDTIPDAPKAKPKAPVHHSVHHTTTPSN